MASLNVEVALVGDPESRGPGVLDDAYFALPYAHRTRVQLEADENDSLASVMERAAELKGIRGPSWSGGHFDVRSNRIAFYKPEDDDGIAAPGMPRLLANELILVDERGQAIFGVYDHRAVRLADLIRASEAGTLEGDPLWAVSLLGLRLGRRSAPGLGDSSRGPQSRSCNAGSPRLGSDRHFSREVVKGAPRSCD
jgi:hypothetical protein